MARKGPAGLRERPEGKEGANHPASQQRVSALYEVLRQEWSSAGKPGGGQSAGGELAREQKGQDEKVCTADV